MAEFSYDFDAPRFFDFVAEDAMIKANAERMKAAAAAAAQVWKAIKPFNKGPALP